MGRAERLGKLLEYMPFVSNVRVHPDIETSIVQADIYPYKVYVYMPGANYDGFYVESLRYALDVQYEDTPVIYFYDGLFGHQENYLLKALKLEELIYYLARICANVRVPEHAPEKKKRIFPF